MWMLHLMFEVFITFGSNINFALNLVHATLKIATDLLVSYSENNDQPSCTNIYVTQSCVDTLAYIKSSCLSTHENTGSRYKFPCVSVSLARHTINTTENCELSQGKTHLQFIFCDFEFWLHVFICNGYCFVCNLNYYLLIYLYLEIDL